MITIACECGKNLKVRDELAGKRAKCPGCGKAVPVPPGARPTKSPAELAVTNAGAADPFATTVEADGQAHSAAIDDTVLNRLVAADSAPFLSPPQSPDEIGRLGAYRVLKILGKGGMGMVLEAEDPQLKRRVALKVMLPKFATDGEAKRRFLREAQAAAALEHDHIIAIYQVGEDNGIPFLAMPLLKGESLADCVQREGKLPLAEVMRIGAEIADGLAAAHDAGLIHRDIKPANIWLDGSRRRVKILDFGLARSVGDDMHLTGTGVVIGTPAYMAPEQARGVKVDHRTDLFSLGCVIYQMAGGKLPFNGTDTFSMLTSLAVDTPVDPREHNPEVPPELSALILHLLAKKPDDRPASANDVLARLRAMQGPVASATALSGSSDTMPKPTTVTKRTPEAITKTFQNAPTKKKSSADTQSIDAPPKKTAVGQAAELARPREQARQLAPRKWLIAAAGLLMLFLGCGGVALFFGGQIIRIATNQGELVIVVDDPTVELKVVQNGLVVYDKTSKREFTLTAGKGEIEVLEKDGIKLTTKQFELTRGGKTTIKVTLEELADARKAKDTDRRAAEWVLSMRGDVKIAENGKERGINAVGDLPKGAFELTFADMQNDPKLSDKGLSHFKDCKNLTEMNLGGSINFSDEGLAHFKDCKNLIAIGLSNTKVGSAGLIHFNGCKRLKQLDLYNTKVDDTGLAYFKDCHDLRSLDLGGTNVSDVGLAHLKDCKNLESLKLSGTKVSNAGLTNFQACKGLARFEVQNLRVDDETLALFEKSFKLSFVLVRSTKATESGVKNLAAALPGCRIESDFGVFGPKTTAATITPNDGPVNLLPLLDLKKDAVAGAWKLDPDGSIRTLPEPRGHYALVFPVAVKGDYRLKLEFTHLGGMEAVTTVFPVGSAQALAVIGSHNNNRSGFGSIDGKPHDENETTRRKMGFVTNKRNIVVIEVRTDAEKSKVTAVWNGDKFVNWSGPFAKLSVPAGIETKDRSVVALRLSDKCSNSSIHSVTLEMLSGEATLLRPEDVRKRVAP